MGQVHWTIKSTSGEELPVAKTCSWGTPSSEPGAWMTLDNEPLCLPSTEWWTCDDGVLVNQPHRGQGTAADLRPCPAPRLISHRARAEDRASHTHPGGSMADGHQVVVGHAHGQLVQTEPHLPSSMRKIG